MKLSCEVVGDLLPLVAENMASAESAALVEEHLIDCPDCRTKWEALREPETQPEEQPDGEAALRAVKKELRRHRLRTAAIAALLVFLPLFALLARSMEEYALPLEQTDVEVEEKADGSLDLVCYGPVTDLESEACTDPDTGELTLLVQAWGSRWHEFHSQGEESVRFSTSPRPDRVIYGFYGEQTLIYGEAMNGGVMALPRLVLAYYIVIALALGGIFGLGWLLLRRKKAGAVFRALCFAGLSYPIGHLLVKGIQTASFHLPRDLGMILIVSAAVFALLMLLRQKRKEE